jgi:hypothetical protein
MECVTCGLQAGYNRAVIDIEREDLRGGLCFRCEEREFGTSLGHGLWRETEGCALCARDAHVALPTWEPFTTEEGGVLICRVDYRLDESTLTLCDEHFAALRPGDGAVRTPVRTHGRE